MENLTHLQDCCHIPSTHDGLRRGTLMINPDYDSSFMFTRGLMLLTKKEIVPDWSVRYAILMEEDGSVRISDHGPCEAAIVPGGEDL